MLFINTNTTNHHSCSYYFGLEEYLIKDYKGDDDIFLLWSVNPTVMIGRHQITTVEIDQKYVNENNIEIIRRNSGGGAVYTDHGCLQFSFITDKKYHEDIFGSHVNEIIAAINKLGLEAKFTGRNDILVNGRKFSGNAEYIHKDKMVIHGTILFDSNLDHLIGSLTPDKSKLTKHAISSVKSRVVNIGSMIDMDIDKFYNYLVNEIKSIEIPLEELDHKKIETYTQKFLTKEWNYGKNPKFEYHNKLKFPSGNVTVDVDIKNNKVKNIRITGDYFSLKKIQEFENAFIGIEFTRKSFLEVTKSSKVREYIYKLKTREFLELFFGEVEKKRSKKPDFLKINLADLNKKTKEIRTLLNQNHLHTVCQEASCPNQLECFSNKTATFMILGTRCTRNCRFCDVEHGKPMAPDKNEPDNLVKAVKVMGLKHIVITSVTRDDLLDYGSKHFVDVITKLKQEVPNTTIEVLIPDFMGDFDAIKRVVKAKPDVINHNLETIRRLYKGFRDNADLDRSLKVLKTVKELDPKILTKTGIMVGIGETKEEVYSLMKELRDIDCNIMTIGQYLQPSKEHVEVVDYISLEDYELYKAKGKELGFRYIAAGPMVRSSYQAYKQFKGE
ncbi:Lipoyl synthase [Candidatus Izimaplasma bacterium HR1]|jgi:lipoic acid synthetase|uniref:lipoyl synthase n=1 Tax=Candidatus Izimoplasma sp. HR1 TaxID=1541959 RepID=UPI0004F71574|nr:Lipoyl synthase [Candidatus Izimaplasma bacterium HR1]